MRLEHVDRRVLGAVEFVDATTGQRLRMPGLRLTASGVRFLRNHSGLYVLMLAPTLTDYTEAFSPVPPLPALLTVIATVSDANGRYLPRQFTVGVPREPDATKDPNVFQPVVVRLFPSPAAPTAAGWAVVRAHVTSAGNDLESALVRVIRTSDNVRLGTGLSDRRGEALIAVPGIPLVNWDQGAGPVIASQIDVRLETVFDPAAGSPPDPDALDKRNANSSIDRKLGAGQELATALSV